MPDREPALDQVDSKGSPGSSRHSTHTPVLLSPLLDLSAAAGSCRIARLRGLLALVFLLFPLGLTRGPFHPSLQSVHSER